MGVAHHACPTTPAMCGMASCPAVSDDSFPIVSVQDLPANLAFYERLGFSQTYAFPPEGPAAFVTLVRDGSVLGIATRTHASADRFSSWVSVDDVDDTFTRLTAAGATTEAGPRNEPWGERVASVRDPDGNVVHLGAPGSSQQ
jgi:catechol 2,3-dioxygenase-like lactoylglutathione lyase family enzyme